jgi:hypothetical protein
MRGAVQLGHIVSENVGALWRQAEKNAIQCTHMYVHVGKGLGFANISVHKIVIK